MYFVIFFRLYICVFFIRMEVGQSNDDHLQTVLGKTGPSTFYQVGGYIGMAIIPALLSAFYLTTAC